MQVQGHDVAICSWSLQPQGMTDLVGKVKQLGLEHMQLAMAELAMLDDKRRHQELGVLRASGIKLTGGMLHFAGEDYSSIARIRETGGFLPDGEWSLRRGITREVAKLGRELKVEHILAHVGFVPPRNDPAYQGAVERIHEVAQIFAGEGLKLIMETGQEPAAELLHFLEDLDRPNVQINFDPANMILYGAGDPIAAIKILGPHIRHVHAKDAAASSQPGVEWGAEVPFGTGQVPVREFLKALHDVGYTGPLAIEREAGNQRMEDVAFAIKTLQQA